MFQKMALLCLIILNISSNDEFVVTTCSSNAPILLHRDAEYEREKEFEAALKIQCWFRGTKVRAYLRYPDGEVGMQSSYIDKYNSNKQLELISNFNFNANFEVNVN